MYPTGAKYTFTIKEGADGKNGRISVNYDGFIDDVGVNDMLLVDGGMLSLKILEKTKQDVVCEVVDGGVMGSRYPNLDCTYSQPMCCHAHCCSGLESCCHKTVSLPACNCSGLSELCTLLQHMHVTKQEKLIGTR